jgi:hypothetical protein
MRISVIELGRLFGGGRPNRVSIIPDAISFKTSIASEQQVSNAPHTICQPAWNGISRVSHQGKMKILELFTNGKTRIRSKTDRCACASV